MSQIGDNLPTADVYGGDTASPDRSSEYATDVFLFAIEADADPDVLARCERIQSREHGAAERESAKTIG